MLKTFQGYFNRGQFVSSEPVEIPDNVEVYVMITDRELQSQKTVAEQQLEAFDRFMFAIDSIEEELFGEEDFADLEKNRADFGRVVAI